MNVTHPAQLAILKALIQNSKGRFVDINTLGLTNDHFTFHLKQLLKAKLIEKEGLYYNLTNVGLEIAGRMSLVEGKFIPQPKVGVALFIQDPVTKKILVGERLHDPYKGSLGFYTEKVRLGEPLREACARCLCNETGLSGEFSYKGTLRVLRRNQGELVTDVLLTYFSVQALRGTLLVETEQSKNAWMSEAALRAHPNVLVDVKKELDLLLADQPFFLESEVNFTR